VAGVPQPRIYTPAEWGAAPPRSRPALLGPPVRTICHGTAGHHREISRPADESLAEFLRYCRDIQTFHMAPPPHGRGWNDSGQNFTIGRNGVIAVGRRYSLAAAQVGLAVESAHCPGQNDQPGVELEHLGDEHPTAEQLHSYVHLVAWLMSRSGMRSTAIDPHRRYWATDCPTDSLVIALPIIRGRVAAALNRYGRDPATSWQRARFRARYLAHLV
jgi:N-acetylmuramoyl-L-alanine amidase-like protein